MLCWLDIFMDISQVASTIDHVLDLFLFVFTYTFKVFSALLALCKLCGELLRSKIHVYSDIEKKCG